jgi:hypothetical protein
MVCNMPTYIICQTNPIEILCRNRSMPDYRSRVSDPACESGIGPMVLSCMQKSTKGSCPYNQEKNHPSAKDGTLSHSGKVAVKEVQGTSMVSPIESNQGESQGWQRIVTLSYLECSLCHVFQHDRCNPGHHYIRWPREP